MHQLKKVELFACRGGYVPITGGGFSLLIIRGVQYLYERIHGKAEGGQFNGGGASGSW